MVSIRYPGSPQAADISGLLGGLDALGEGLDNRRARQGFDSFDGWLRSQTGAQQPMSLASLDPQPQTDPASARVAQAHNASGNPSYRNAIKSIESAGSGDYAAVGPAHPKLGRALGAYQVMEANIGPWSKEVFGKEMTPEQFLANPKAQDVIFDRKFGSYVDKFGSPEKAAQAWFAGEGGVGTNRQDSLGTSVPEYAQKFTQALGGAPQPAMASMGGGMPQSAPQATQMAQGGSMLPPREVMQQLFRSEQTRPIAVALAKSALDARKGDPEAALRLQKLSLEVERLRNPDAGGTEYGLNPIWGVDPETNEPVLGTMGKDGSFKRVDTGGVKLEAGVDRVDLGTQWGLLNKRTGQIEGYMPKDLAGAEAQKEIGTAQGKATAAASSDMQSAQNALDLIDSLRTDPNRERGTGFSATFNAVPGTRGYDFQTKVDQAKSGAFLSAIQQLRGMGALSNAEGQTATSAVTRLNTATSEEEFMAALDDYEKIVRQGYEKAAGRGGAAPAAGNDYKTKYGLD